MKWSKGQEAVLSTGGNLLVSASAGSGKTAVMVEKVLRLVKEGTDIRRILLMTFTRAAAAEMKEKLVKKMYEASSKADGEKVKEQLANLPFASIETIDGFCYRMARQYFNVVGCDPSASIGEDKAMEKALFDCATKVMEESFVNEDADFLRAADFFRKNRSYEPYKQTVIDIIKFASSRPNRDGFYRACAGDNSDAVEKFYLNYRRNEIALLIKDVTGFIDECESENFFFDELYTDIVKRLEAAKEAVTVAEFFSPVENVIVPRKINVNKVKKGEASEELADLSGRVNARIKSFLTGVVGDAQAYRSGGSEQQRAIKRSLSESCIETEKAYAAYKKKRNLIDMRDATDYALKALDDEKTRKEVSEKYDYVFVDEYQDTNYLQETLIERITSDNLFSVGDVKQAIYHFRSAEPDIFLKRESRYDTLGEGSNRYLNVNYRSCEEVLDFTNRVCDAIMVKDFCGIDYKNTARLGYGGLERPIKGVDPVSVFIDSSEDPPTHPLRGEVYGVKDAPISDSSDNESEFIANDVLSAVNGCFITEKDGSERKVNFGDFAVLLRAGTKMKLVTSAFKKYGVPFYTLKENASAFPEREVLVDVVRVALNATDDASMYNAASSPVGSFSPSELVEIRSFNGNESRNCSLWEAFCRYSGIPKLKNKAEEFVEYIEEIRRKCAYMSVSELFEEILSRNFDAYLRGHNPVALGELNAFISFVSSLGVNSSCEEFIDYYDTSYKGNKPPARENAVAIMTMHASKGLEFPIVYLPYQGSRPMPKVGQTELDAELGLAVKLYGEEEGTVGDTFATRVVRLKCREEERQELARLMYVAFTRAKNRLVVTGREVKVPLGVYEGNTILQWIAYAAESDEVLRSTIKDLPKFEAAGAEKKVAEEKPFDKNLLEKNYAFEKETALPMKYSVSEILKKNDGYGYNPFAKKGKAAAVGTAVHTVMQYIDYSVDDEDGVKKTVEELFLQGALTEEEAASVDEKAILRTLRSDVIREARKYPIKREQPFMMYVPYDDESGKVLVQGVIDLLIDEGDGYVVVDFKTGGGSEEELRNRYGKQLSLYAEGVEKILKKPVKRKIIYAINSGKTVET